jgi:hypothetical protein
MLKHAHSSEGKAPMRRLSAVWLLLVLGLCLGCRPPEDSKPPKDLKEWFEQKNTSFNSEDGVIDFSTLREVAPNTLEYQTTKNGVRKTWRQTFRPDGSGSYERVGDPKDVTEEIKGKPAG